MQGKVRERRPNNPIIFSNHQRTPKQSSFPPVPSPPPHKAKTTLRPPKSKQRISLLHNASSKKPEAKEPKPTCHPEPTQNNPIMASTKNAWIPERHRDCTTARTYPSIHQPIQFLRKPEPKHKPKPKPNP